MSMTETIWEHRKNEQEETIDFEILTPKIIKIQNKSCVLK